MSGFLYCFVGSKVRNAPDAKILKELGLDHLVGAALSQGGYLGGGEMGGPGVICAIAQRELADGGCEPKVGYYPKTQEWVKGGEGWWIGWEKDNPPRAVDLMKGDWMGGHEVELGDGGIWVIPPERFLPSQMVLNDKMEVERVPLPEFDEIRHLTSKLNADFQVYISERPEGEEQPEEQMSGAEQLQAAIFFVGLNYRVGRVEANVLKLWNDRTLLEMLCAIWNLPDGVALVKEFAAADKKKSLKTDADISAVEGGGIPGV